MSTRAAGTLVVEHATCLGCGCACDDITVHVEGGRIAQAERACPLGEAWFGDGQVPSAVTVRGQGVSLEEALDEATRVLAGAPRPLVYLAADISCETQREGTAIADRLRAVLDTLTSSTALESVLASQRRGRAGATLGEVRNRGDLIVFWGVDPVARYPRYRTRYAPDPEGLHVPAGRRGRRVVAVDVGEARGPADADVRVPVAPLDEVSTLALVRAIVLGRTTDEDAGADVRVRRAAELARLLTEARYAVIVHDAEPSPGRDPGRAEALVALALTLNGPTRCALSTLRGGGNRSGADAVLTWQTGFPTAVDFTRGAPRYRPDEGAASLLARGEIDAALVLGSPASIPDDVAGLLGRVPTVAIGPRASGAPFTSAVAIDTGVAGIHEAGIAVRMDEVQLPLRPSLPSPRDTASVVRELAARLARVERAGRVSVAAATTGSGPAGSVSR